jgi:hypothetical protein
VHHDDRLGVPKRRVIRLRELEVERRRFGSAGSTTVGRAISGSSGARLSAGATLSSAE